MHVVRTATILAVEIVDTLLGKGIYLVHEAMAITRAGFGSGLARGQELLYNIGHCFRII